MLRAQTLEERADEAPTRWNALAIPDEDAGQSLKVISRDGGLARRYEVKEIREHLVAAFLARKDPPRPKAKDPPDGFETIAKDLDLVGLKTIGSEESADGAAVVPDAVWYEARGVNDNAVVNVGLAA